MKISHNFKKSTLIICVTLLMLFLLGCNKDDADIKQPTEKTHVRVAALKGPTGMAMVKMMEDNLEGKTINDYDFSILGAPDEVVAQITSGQVDIACVPTNVASALYNKTNGNVKIININTLGVLYVLERNSQEIQNIEDLKGKTILSTGQGATPEYVLNYILRKNGLDPEVDLNIEYKSEHSELATLLASGQADLAVLPQPFVTSVLVKNSDVRVVLDLTKEWQKVSGEDKPLAMGVTIVSNEFLKENQLAVDTFIDEMNMSVQFTNEKLEEAAGLIEKYEIMPAAVAKAAIPACNIVSIKGEEMKKAVEGFLEVLFNSNPKSIGGKIPDENLYYIQ